MKTSPFYCCIFIALTSSCFSQVTDVITNLSTPTGLVINDGKLYISESGKNRVISIDIEANTNEITEVATGLIYPLGLEIYANDLLIAENDAAKLSIKNIDNTSTSVETFITFESPTIDPYGLLIKDQTLYTSGVGGYLFEVDMSLSDPIAVPTLSRSDGTVLNLIVFQDHLYYTESEIENSMYGSIKKVDLMSSNPESNQFIGNLDSPVGLTLANNHLYFSEPELNKIFRIDLSDANPSPVEVLSNLDGPGTLYIHDDFMYISQLDKVSRVQLATLGTSNIEKPQITIYPNPTSDVLILGGIESETTYAIFSITGKKVKKGLTSDQKIDVNNLEQGLYFLELNNNNKIIKFLKE